MYRNLHLITHIKRVTVVVHCGIVFIIFTPFYYELYLYKMHLHPEFLFSIVDNKLKFIMLGR